MYSVNRSHILYDKCTLWKSMFTNYEHLIDIVTGLLHSCLYMWVLFFCQNNYKADKVVNAKNSYVVIIHVIINDNCIMLLKLAVK